MGRAHVTFPEPPSYQSVRIKLARAESLISQLPEIFDTYLATEPFQFRFGIAHDGEGELEVSILRTPDEATGILGDILHNLRAALDNLACDAVRRRGGDDQAVYFPISNSEAHWEKAVERSGLRKAGDTVIAVFKGLSPWSGGNEYLRALHELNIIDKHRAVAPSFLGGHTEVRAPFDQFGRPSVERAWIEVQSTDWNFADDTVLEGRPVVTTLEEMLLLCRLLLESVDALDQ